MKFRITYLPEQEKEAADNLAAILRKYPNGTVHKGKANPPFLTINVAIKDRKSIAAARKNG